MIKINIELVSLNVCNAVVQENPFPERAESVFIIFTCLYAYNHHSLLLKIIRLKKLAFSCLSIQYNSPIYHIIITTFVTVLVTSDTSIHLINFIVNYYIYAPICINRLIPFNRDGLNITVYNNIRFAVFTSRRNR